MSAGRRPLPTALKVLRGNPGKRAINHAEPKPEAKIPTCPPHLSDEAKKEWRWISKELHALGLLTTIDRSALAAYCQVWARWIKAELQVAEVGEIVKAPHTGFPIQNPYLPVANAALKQMKAYLIEFGMTPSSRSKLAIDTSPAAPSDEEFLFGRSRRA